MLRILIVSNLILMVLFFMIVETYGKFSAYLGIFIIGLVVRLVTASLGGKFWEGCMVVIIIITGIWAVGYWNG
jgi:hypothetical protein